MNTSLQALLGLRLPVVQAPMAGSQGSALALAVTNAGGLGSLPAATLSPAQLRDELEVMHRGAQGPWNVNFFCHVPPSPDPVREQLECADMVHRPDVQRQAAPDEVGAEGGRKSEAKGSVHARDL